MSTMLANPLPFFLAILLWKLMELPTTDVSTLMFSCFDERRYSHSEVHRSILYSRSTYLSEAQSANVLFSYNDDNFL